MTHTLHKEDLQVTFVPEKGMNFTSYRRGGLEVIDQSTQPLFDERFAGLGPLIGPHFHHRKVVPPVPHSERFPHIARVQARGTPDPFSHGVGRYAPWTVEETTDTVLQALLRGKDEWEGIALKELEGQDFTMRYRAELTAEGLQIELSVVSAADSVVGLHTYYALGGGAGKVKATVQREYNDQGTLKPIPAAWSEGGGHTLCFDLAEPCDFGFRPYPDPMQGAIELETPTHRLRVSYISPNAENQWQLWHPKGASFVCIEPLSAKDPRKPHLTVSSIKILISIL